MIPKERLKDLLGKRDFTRLDKLLICLATDEASAKSVGEVKEIAVSAGLRDAAKWNVSDILRKANGLASLTSDGWELLADGRQHVAGLVGPSASLPVATTAANLRKHLVKIQNPGVREFLEEAIEAFEHGLYRSAIVFSWVGAVGLLYSHVIGSCLPAFNQEASRRNAKWKPAKTPDDLGALKEFEFLQILNAISIIGKNVRQDLEAQLKLRNGCGHPNSFAVGELKASAHIETLILNVFKPFS